MKKGKLLNRRQFIKTTGLGIGAVSIMGSIPAWAKSGKPDSLVIGFVGGDNLTFAQKIVDKPFSEKYGISIKHYTSKHAQRLVKLKTEVPKPSFQCYYSKGNYMAQAVDMNLLEPLDASIIPNYGDIYDNFKSKYWVGAQFIQEGILYNTRELAPPNSLEAMWNPKYKGKVAAHRFVDRLVMQASLYATGGKAINNEKLAWEAIEALVIDQKAKHFTSSEQLGDMMGRGEILIATYWQARANMWADAGLPIGFAVPKEGGISEVWGWGIPRGVSAEVKKYAGLYISSWVSPEVGSKYADALGYPCCNKKVTYAAKQDGRLPSQGDILKMKSPDYSWLMSNIEKWTEKYNKLLSKS